MVVVSQVPSSVKVRQDVGWVAGVTMSWSAGMPSSGTSVPSCVPPQTVFSSRLW